MQAVQLGLIGDQIGRSKSPLLHRLAGELCGLAVDYRPLIPAAMSKTFDQVFDDCVDTHYRGINITYPYKEQVFHRLVVDDPRVKAMGACNTVVFDDEAHRGYNTDYTGFIQAYRHAFANAAPGAVALVGAGGVGKAIAFGLLTLGAHDIRIVDNDVDKAQALSQRLLTQSQALRVAVTDDIAEALAGSDGVINATPIGMFTIPGTAVPKALLGGRRWAFDAVYTPIETEFLTDARNAGLDVITGYELFFHQGVEAFKIFTTKTPDTVALRQRLSEATHSR